MKYEKNRKIAGMDEYKVMKIAKIAIIPVVVIILILVIVLADKKNKPSAKKATEATTEVVTSSEESSSEEDYSNSFEGYGLQQNVVPEVNELVAKYQRAKVTGDAELMYKVFGKTPDDDMNVLQVNLTQESSVYESYDHTVCYTTQGLEENSYIVFIASDLKFEGIDTPAPMLTWAYIYKADDGNYYMKEPDTLTEEEKELLDTVSASEDVKMLDNDMRTRLAQAVISDAKLATLYQIWSDNGTPEETEADPDAIHLDVDETSGETDESAEEADIQIGVEE